jgi:hypothetical protein
VDWQALDNVVSPVSEDEPFGQVLDDFRALAARLQGLLAPGSIVVRVEPGYVTKLGQQLRVVVAIPSREFEDVLFRAYVPPGGFPVSLDFFGEDVVECADDAALEREVTGFLGRDEMRTRLDALRRLASE